MDINKLGSLQEIPVLPVEILYKITFSCGKDYKSIANMLLLFHDLRELINTYDKLKQELKNCVVIQKVENSDCAIIEWNEYPNGENIGEHKLYIFIQKLDKRNKILSSTWHEKNKKRHGECKSFRNGQNILYRCNYKEGRMDGEYKEYYSNTCLHIQCNYVAGKLNGEYKIFDYDGCLSSLHNFTNDTPDGEQKEWYHKGGLQRIYNYKNGDLHGEYKEYNKDGNLYSYKIYECGYVIDQII